MREEIAKERRIGGPPVDHSVELAAAAGAADGARRDRLRLGVNAVGPTEPFRKDESMTFSTKDCLRCGRPVENFLHSCFAKSVVIDLELAYITEQEAHPLDRLSFNELAQIYGKNVEAERRKIEAQVEEDNAAYLNGKLTYRVEMCNMRRWDSNPHLPLRKCGALSIELRRHIAISCLSLRLAQPVKSSQPWPVNKKEKHPDRHSLR